MKSIFAACLLVLSFVSFAEDCVKDICAGNLVMDNFNNVGTVIRFDRNHDTITFKADGTAWFMTTSQSLVVKSVDSTEFPVNSRTLDSFNNVGRVLAVFADGRIQYKQENSFFINVSKTLSPEVKEVDGIKANDRVVDSMRNVGTVLAVFANGKKAYLQDGSNFISVTDKLVIYGNEVHGQVEPQTFSVYVNETAFEQPVTNLMLKLEMTAVFVSEKEAHSAAKGIVVKIEDGGHSCSIQVKTNHSSIQNQVQTNEDVTEKCLEKLYNILLVNRN